MRINIRGLGLNTREDIRVSVARLFPGAFMRGDKLSYTSDEPSDPDQPY